MVSHTDFSTFSVFVVDDDPLILSLIDAALQTLGVGTICVESDGREAIARLAQAQQPVNVLFCDLNMPDMDGMTLMHELADMRFAGAVVLMTGEDRRILNAASTLAEALGLTLGGAVNKPVTLQMVCDLLEKAGETAAERRVSAELPVVTEQQLRDAIAQDEIEVFYQPKISVKTRAVVGAEALVRWRSPVLGLVPPNAFIPMAERTTLITDLLDVVAEKAIADAGAWQRSGYPLCVALNVSVNSLTRMDLPEFLLSRVRQAGLRPQNIMLEVTESQLMREEFKQLEVLCRLAMLGFNLSIDDFGTGYSSLSKLTKLPFSELKVDRLFVSGATSDQIARTILETSTVLGHKLGMSIVSEGVEDQEDWDLVAACGSDVVQGFFIARPMPRDAFDRWLQEWKAPRHLL